MLASFKREYTQFITSGGQLLLLFAGFKFNSPTAWLWCLGTMAALSLFAWYSALHRYRLLRGTPTSRIGSAAQGYVEVIGHGEALDNSPIYAKYSHLPCLWYRYLVEYRDSRNKWHRESTGESHASFLIDDGTGKCIVDPDGAEIICDRKETWYMADYRYTEWRLLDHDFIYALGQFKTAGGSTNTTTHKELVNQVLTEWKQDQHSLLRRFDLDNNGSLDMQEWMLARQAAKREAHQRLAQARSQPDTHFMLHPHDGRLFLISNLSPQQLVSRYHRWAWFHVAVFLGSLLGLARFLPH